MKIKPLSAILVALAIFAAGIALTAAAGIWSTKTRKMPVRYQDTQYAGQYDPADIRGSYTFEDISSLYHIPLTDLCAAFGVSQNAASAFQCKNLESIYGDSPYEVGTASVRMFTAYYLGLPYSASAETYLPAAAADILVQNGHMPAQQQEELKDYAIPPQ